MRTAGLVFLATFIIVPGVWAQDLAIGLFGGGLVTHEGGTLLSSETAVLSRLGASNFSSSGSGSSCDEGLFPSWGAGVFGSYGMGAIGDCKLRAVVELGFGRWGSCYTIRSDQNALIARYGVMLYSIDLPLVVRAELKIGGGTSFVDAGGFLSFVPWAKDTESGSAGGATSDLPLSVPLMPGACCGVGYELPLGRGKLSFELRGDYGFETLTASMASGDRTISAYRISLWAAYGIPLAGKAALTPTKGKKL
jgi:hypothetical protein